MHEVRIIAIGVPVAKASVSLSVSQSVCLSVCLWYENIEDKLSFPLLSVTWATIICQVAPLRYTISTLL